jgi:hypothetical protein
MSELTQARLFIALLLLAVVGAWLLAHRTAQRRRTRFLDLAAAMGSAATLDGEFALHFVVEINGRAIAVGCRHLGSGMGASNAAPGW